MLEVMKEGTVNHPQKIHIHSQSTSKEFNVTKHKLFSAKPQLLLTHKAKLLPRKSITTKHLHPQAHNNPKTSYTSTLSCLPIAKLGVEINRRRNVDRARRDKESRGDLNAVKRALVSIMRPSCVSRSTINSALTKASSVKFTLHKSPKFSAKEMLDRTDIGGSNEDECNVDTKDLEDHIMSIPSTFPVYRANNSQAKFKASL